MANVSKESIENVNPSEMAAEHYDSIQSLLTKISEEDVSNPEGIGFITSIVFNFVQSVCKLYQILNAPPPEEAPAEDE